MNKEEIKKEIDKKLDLFPTETLEQLYSYLKDINQQNASLFNIDNLKKILTEDKDLLMKLAQ